MSTTAEKIAVMKAFDEGKEIEVFYKGAENPSWTKRGSGSTPSWNWGTYDYRVAREARDLWLQECRDDFGKPTGLWQEKFWGVGKHFREVLE